ncbi:MAG: hypothetical protein ACREMA_12330, partial [Longimicrobiales bacterium]
IRPLTHGRWRDQQPRWSNRGERIAFSSDRDGFFDLYAVDLQGQGARITGLTGGAFDPEWLPDDSGLVFAGFSEGTFRVYQYPLNQPAAAAMPVIAYSNGEPAPAWDWETTTSKGSTPPRTILYSALDRISLDFAGGDAAFAPGLGSAQGAQLLLSDMLGNHILFAGISAAQTTRLTDLVDHFSGNLLYLNMARRLNYGVGLFRFEGRFRDVTYDIYNETTAGAYFLAGYPFSRFSRLELQLALEKSKRLDLEDFYDHIRPDNGLDASDLTRQGTLASNYLSYVKDNTLWVATGPIDGERFNVSLGLVSCFACTYPSEVTGEPISRSAAVDNYVFIGDYRRYLRTTQHSAYALRAYLYLSSGRLPGRAVLGGPHRLRGYPRFSLAGSRVWLLNQEWRFPVLNGLNLSFPFGDLRLPGIQGALFADGGSSWLDSQTKASGTWGSYGLGLRTTLGPPFVLRMDAGRRFRIGAAPPVVFGSGERFNDSFVDFFFGFNY